MVALYGPIKEPIGVPMGNVSLPNFAGGPLRVSDPTSGWQGTCDTFVIWSKYMRGQPGGVLQKSPFEKLHESLDQPSIPHGGNHQRPGWWDTISHTGIRAIRQSDFLFVRKFIDKPRLSGDGGDGGDGARVTKHLHLSLADED